MLKSVKKIYKGGISCCRETANKIEVCFDNETNMVADCRCIKTFVESDDFIKGVLGYVPERERIEFEYEYNRIKIHAVLIDDALVNMKFMSAGVLIYRGTARYNGIVELSAFLRSLATYFESSLDLYVRGCLDEESYMESELSGTSR